MGGQHGVLWPWNCLPNGYFAIAALHACIWRLQQSLRQLPCGLDLRAAAHPLLSRSALQELLDCLDLLLAVEKVDDVRAHLGPILARKQAGLLASFTQVRADGA